MSEHWLKCNETKTEFMLLEKNSALEKMMFKPSADFGESKSLLWTIIL